MQLISASIRERYKRFEDKYWKVQLWICAMIFVGGFLWMSGLAFYIPMYAWGYDIYGPLEHPSGLSFARPTLSDVENAWHLLPCESADDRKDALCEDKRGVVWKVVPKALESEIKLSQKGAK